MDDPYPHLRGAIQYLSGVCDGAKTLDDVGFDGADTGRGKKLAREPVWSASDARWAAERVRKYHRQLDDETQTTCAEEAKTIPPGDVDAHGTPNGRVELYFDYDPDLITLVKQIEGRRWNNDDRVWHIPLDSMAQARELLGTRLNEYDIPTTTVPPTPTKPELHIWQDGNDLVFRTPITAKDDIKDQLHGRKWNPDSRTWTAPASPVNLSAAIEIAHKHNLLLEPALESMAKAATAAREAERRAASAAVIEDAPRTFPGFGLELYPFQAAGVAVARARKRIIIGDQMGLGKTIQGLATIHAEQAYPCVIVCPATLRGNWRREAKRTLPSELFIHAVMNGRDGPRGTEHVVIVSYEGLTKHIKRLVALRPKAVIFDEAHYLKNRKAKRTSAARVLAGRPKPTTPRQAGDLDTFKLAADAVGVPEIALLLTGTAILNRPQELIEPLSIIGRLDDVGGFWHFATRWCGYDRAGGWGAPQNLPELHARLLELCMVRRMKQDVLKELPPKQRSVVKVKVTNGAEYEKAQGQVKRWYAQAKGGSAQHVAAQGLVEINELRKLAGAGKVAPTIELLQDYVENEEPVVVFTHHHHVTDAIVAGVPGAKKLDGRTPPEDRDRLVASFQDGKIPVLVCGIKAAGVGLTLTRASSVLIVELPWTMADVQQAEDRLHRIGQEASVNSYWVLGESTIDESMALVLEQKARIVDQALDGVAAEDQGEGGMVRAVLEQAFGRQAELADYADEEQDANEAEGDRRGYDYVFGDA